MIKQVYTCPMHPKVVESHPGSCPYCGMDLESRFGSDTDPTRADFQRRFWMSLVCTLLVFFVEPLFQMLLASFVVLWGGWPLYKRGVKTKEMNMFSLITMGVGTAYFYSIWAYFHHESLYFEAATMIITLVLVGQLLEMKAREKTGGAIQALLKLSPQVATLETGEEIALEKVKKGDRLRIRPGEKIPVDGVIRTGSGSIDLSMLTGESMLVEKGIGDKVIGGSINGSGSFIFEAEAVREETVLFRILEQVAAAEMSRAPIQRLADKVARYFAWIVLLIALLTLFGWGFFASWTEGLMSAAAVLIIACPCALGLGAPLSIRVGVGEGALHGVLFKNAAALEKLSEIDTLIMDKTGTLTEGKISLDEVIPLGALSNSELLQLAASLEVGSEHPLAKAIVSQNKLSLLPVESFKTRVGSGVEGVILGRNLRMEKAPSEEIALRSQGKTVLCLYLNDEPSALFVLSDRIKEGAEKQIALLKKQKIDLIMVTGDHPLTAKAVAEKLHLDHFVSEALPEQKLTLIKKYQSMKRCVAMAGDGVNDAPALAAADVSIAMGTGTDVAIQVSDITLLKGDLLGIIFAITLSRRVLRNIKENLFFAFLYNFLAVPIAAAALLSPMIASIAMTLSSLSIVLNVLRLKYTVR